MGLEFEKPVSYPLNPSEAPKMNDQKQPVDLPENEQQPEYHAGVAMMVAEANQAIQAPAVLAQHPNNRRMPATLTKEIVDYCKQREFAEIAMFKFRRGNEMVSGPSIRCAELVAQIWGHMKWGLVEVERTNGKSLVKGYAWDMQRNNFQDRANWIPHAIKLKTGKLKYLNDPRDIKDLINNYGQRIVRECIKGVIPRDIWDRVEVQVRATLSEEWKGQSVAKRCKDMVIRFATVGVTEEMLLGYIRKGKVQDRRLEDTTDDEFFDLKAIFNTISQKEASIADWFGDKAPETSPEALALTEALNKVKPPTQEKTDNERLSGREGTAARSEEREVSKT